MTASSQLETNKKVYRRYIEILNNQDFAALPEVSSHTKNDGDNTK